MKNCGMKLWIILASLLVLFGCPPINNPDPAVTPTTTPTLTNTPPNTSTPTDTAADTPTPTDTATNTSTPTDTATNTSTNTPSPTNSATNTPTPTNTATDTPTPANTPTPLSSAKAIISFALDNTVSSVTIVESTHTVTAIVPIGTNRAALTPIITHTGASTNPPSGIAWDFTNPVTFTVTAANNSTQDYTVSVRIGTLPSLETEPMQGNPINAKNIAGSFAYGYGNIFSAGDTAVTERGICWNTTGNPTLADTKGSSGTGTGTYSVYMNLLTINTVYHIRAYAINIAGTAYGADVSFNSGLAFGTVFGGGLVFYNDGNGHGLVVSQVDQALSISWYNGTYKSTGAYDAQIGAGQANTTAIVTSQGAGYYAAKQCDDLDYNGYTDWFLPTLGDLIQINERLINANLMTVSSNSHYWSSTQASNSTAYGVTLIYTLYWDALGTNTNQYVRAARFF
jgi:hypothetical protein